MSIRFLTGTFDDPADRVAPVLGWLKGYPRWTSCENGYVAHEKSMCRFPPLGLPVHSRFPERMPMLGDHGDPKSRIWEVTSWMRRTATSRGPEA